MNYRKTFDLSGKVAVVTGGAGLIGSELVLAFSQMGAAVIIADTQEPKSAAQGVKIIFRKLDITSEKSVAGSIKFVDKEFGKLDIWVNSAYPKTKDWGRKFREIKSSSWRKNIDMHLNGYMLCSRAAAEYMRSKKCAGSIINLSSIYGMLGPDFSVYKNTSLTMPAAYSAIKGGIINFTRYLASYYGKDKIRVNSISCGGIYDKQPDTFVEKYKSKTLLGRMGKAEDIAGAVVYLAADVSNYVTGHNLVVDGGFSII